MSPSLMLLQLLGSVALLLWGLRMVRTAAERALGAELDRYLQRLAGSRLRAFLCGGAGAAAVQSSTAMILLAAGFVGKARMTLASGLAVALGADVGTAVAARILSLDLSLLGPAALAVGYICFKASRAKRFRNLGRALIGLGLILLALGQIVGLGAIARGAEATPILISAIAGAPALAILIAAALTWLVHSSLAVVLLIASLAGAGALAGEPALYLLLGANLGAALPALAASLSEPLDGRRVAAGNLLFRGLGVLALSGAVGAYHAEMRAYGLSEPDIVILGHLAFNLALAVAALPFVVPVARLLERALPAPPEVERPRAAPRHLHRKSLANPARALGNARREGLRLSELVQEMLDDSEAALGPGAPRELLDAISSTEDEVDSLNSAIKFYVTELTRERLSRDQSRQAHGVISFATNMEHIADIVERNIRRLADRKAKLGLEFSPEGAAEIAEIYEMLREAMQTAIAAFMADDEDLAEQLIAQKRAFRAEELLANQRHLDRLREGNEASIDTSAIHLDLLRDLKRIHSHLTAIAYAIAERDGPPLQGSE